MRISDFKVEVPLAAGEYEYEEYGDDEAAGGGIGIGIGGGANDLRAVVNLIDSIDNSNSSNRRNNNNIQDEDDQDDQDDQSMASDRSNHHRRSRSTETSSSSSKNHQRDAARKIQEQQKAELADDIVGGSGFTDSLEDLVSHFDEKISQCFKNFTQNTESIAPVQVRTQEEIMNESQIWWTLTGNFGNILPIDWTKTYARKLQLPALHLLPKKEENGGSDTRNELDVSDDEELAQALDLHSLIATSLSPPDPPPQTADQVIEEIDEIMQQSCTSELTGSSDMTMESGVGGDSLCSPLKSPLPLAPMIMLQDPDLETRLRDATSMASSQENLGKLPYKNLAALHSELESLIQIYNETLVQELALRDELEYEKELKNTFISLLLSIQNKRRKWHIDRKRRSSSSNSATTAAAAAANNGAQPNQPHFLTAVIPYHDGCGILHNGILQNLIKILRAVNEDSPNVPNLLTEYILNVLCPSNANKVTTPVH